MITDNHRPLISRDFPRAGDTGAPQDARQQQAREVAHAFPKGERAAPDNNPDPHDKPQQKRQQNDGCKDEASSS